MKKIGKDLRRKIYSMVPWEYRPILRQTFRDCPKMETPSQQASLRRMARDDALSCIQFHERVNHWNTCNGLTEDALKENASLETILYLMKQDFACGPKEHSCDLVFYDRKDVLEAAQNYPWDCESLLRRAFCSDREWVLQWMSENETRRKYMHENASALLLDQLSFDFMMCPARTTRWLMDRDLIAASDQESILNEMVLRLCCVDLKEKLRTRLICQRLSGRIQKATCDEICEDDDDIYDASLLVGFKYCQCGHPERHRE